MCSCDNVKADFSRREHRGFCNFSRLECVRYGFWVIEKCPIRSWNFIIGGEFKFKCARVTQKLIFEEITRKVEKLFPAGFLGLKNCFFNFNSFEQRKIPKKNWYGSELNYKNKVWCDYFYWTPEFYYHPRVPSDLSRMLEFCNQRALRWQKTLPINAKQCICKIRHASVADDSSRRKTIFRDEFQGLWEKI